MTLANNRRSIAFLLAFLASMAILGALVGLPKAEASSEWQPLSEIVDTQLLTQIITENTAPSANRDEIAASAIGKKQSDLLVIDFQSTSLCGIGGCAIAAYNFSTEERILFTYANRPTLDEEIVEIVEKDTESLPCISFIRGNETEPATICYRENEWVTE